MRAHCTETACTPSRRAGCAFDLGQTLCFGELVGGPLRCLLRAQVLGRQKFAADDGPFAEGHLLLHAPGVLAQPTLDEELACQVLELRLHLGAVVLHPGRRPLHREQVPRVGVVASINSTIVMASIVVALIIVVVPLVVLLVVGAKSRVRFVE